MENGSLKKTVGVLAYLSAGIPDYKLTRSSRPMSQMGDGATTAVTERQGDVSSSGVITQTRRTKSRKPSSVYGKRVIARHEGGLVHTIS